MSDCAIPATITWVLGLALAVGRSHMLRASTQNVLEGLCSSFANGHARPDLSSPPFPCLPVTLELP